MSIFNSILVKKPKSTWHDLSHSSQFTGNIGAVMPMLCEKINPGERIRLQHQLFCQLNPFAQQVFQNYSIRTEYFFVPTRILWPDFEKFLVGGEDGLQDFPHPQFNLGGLYRCFIAYYFQKYRHAENTPVSFFEGTLIDYFNFPFDKQWRDTYLRPVSDEALNEHFELINSIPDFYVDVLPFIAYWRLYTEFYRDENLDSLQPILKEFENLYINELGDINWNSVFNSIKNGQYEQFESGFSFLHYFNPFNRCWPKDLFTSALPFAQRGEPVQIPFSGSGDINFTAPNHQDSDLSGEIGYVRMTDGEPDPTSENVNLFTKLGLPVTGKLNVAGGLATVQNLRTSLVLESWLEKNARGGARYKEQIYSHFGVKTKDYRLYRPEYLLGTTQPVTFGNVYTTTQNLDDTGFPGKPTSVANSHSLSSRRKYKFFEHGYLLAVCSLIPQATYFQGVPRQFTELDKFDYYWPEFQHIGEQEIKKSEVLFHTFFSRQQNHNYNEQTFGYSPRYYQYKTRLNEIHGYFRTKDISKTAARYFRLNTINLNEQFVSVNPRVNNLNRPFVYQNDIDIHPLQFDINFSIKIYRPMDYYGIPRVVAE